MSTAGQQSSDSQHQVRKLKEITMANGKNSGGTATLINPMEAVEAARQAAEQAQLDAVKAETERREGLVSQILELAGQIVEADTNLENLGVEEFGEINLSNLDYCVVLTAPRKQRRSTGGGGGATGGGYGSKPCTLPDGILIAMNGSRKGTEFGIAEVHEAVQADPVNYPFSGEEATQRTQINQNLSVLVKAGHVERVGRGVYVITADGQAAAKVALKEMTDRAAEADEG
jgi:hypothetical protein